MALSRDILLKRLTLIACLYFMLLGMFDIGMDIWHGTLTWFQTTFNLAFFIPILFRKQPVHLFMGVVFFLLWSYLLVGGMVTLSLFDESIEVSKQYAFAAFLLFSFCCSLILIWSGIHISEERNSELAPS